MTEWTPQSRLRSWKANRQKYDGFGLAQVIEDYEATLASLTALREAADQLIVMWRGRANLERRGHWWAMLEDCADELSTALATSQVPSAQTDRD